MKTLTLTVVLVISVLSMPISVVADEPASQIGEVALPAAAMSLDGTWVMLDEVMTAPAFFTVGGSPWTWDEPYLVRFSITDYAVISDRFEVYDNGVLVATTSDVPDWDVLGYANSGVGYTLDPDVALADGRFSAAVLYFGPGAHSITIRDIHIPPTTAGGIPFIDGTVAFKAEPLVEFTKEITDTVEGGDGDGVLETGEDWHWTLTATLTNISGETIHVDKVHDRLGGDLESHGGWYYAKMGSIDYYTNGNSEKWFFNWYDGFDLVDGESVAFALFVSPDINPGTGNGKKSGKQEYTSPGEHCLNSGAWFEGYIGDEYIEASTEPVCVDVVEAD